jgi:hypothetical protein
MEKFEHYNKASNIDYSNFDKSMKPQGMSNVKTTFSSNLEEGIMGLLTKYKQTTLKQITDHFGDYVQVHTKLKDMILDGKILTYEVNKDNITGEITNQPNYHPYELKIIKIVDPDKSFWNHMNAQPCLTCPIMSECSIDNPVSPATCDDFQDWLQSEIDLEFMNMDD